MDPAISERSRSGQAMAGLPSKPSRSDCRHGLLHRPNPHVMRWQRRLKNYFLMTKRFFL